jgi:two-component system LytT family response regulator
MKAVIVDDEALARKSLESLVEQFCPGLEVCSQAENVPQAIKVIMEHQPDIVFLDIEMPGFSGLELPNFFKDSKIDFHIIFTTAYAQYAVQAFRLSAVDYLLKPIDIEELQAAIEKVKELDQAKTTTEQMQLVQSNLQQPNNPERIALSTAEGIEFVKPEEISFLQADGSYVHVHLVDGHSLMLSKKLGEFDFLEELPNFYKPHRSYLINLNQIQKYLRADGGAIVMNGGQQIPLSKHRKQEFMELMGNH